MFICGLGVIDWRKNQRSKITWHCFFKLYRYCTDCWLSLAHQYVMQTWFLMLVSVAYIFRMKTLSPTKSMDLKFSMPLKNEPPPWVPLLCIKLPNFSHWRSWGMKPNIIFFFNLWSPRKYLWCPWQMNPHYIVECLDAPEEWGSLCEYLIMKCTWYVCLPVSAHYGLPYLCIEGEGGWFAWIGIKSIPYEEENIFLFWRQ
jgi:hypothetical protein